MIFLILIVFLGGLAFGSAVAGIQKHTKAKRKYRQLVAEMLNVVDEMLNDVSSRRK